MSPSSKFLRLVVSELESKATMEEIPNKIRNKDVAVLANGENETTVGAWLRDESRNRQFSALLAMLSYLPVPTMTAILDKMFPDKPRSIRQALEENRRTKKPKSKAKKKPAKNGHGLTDHPSQRN